MNESSANNQRKVKLGSISSGTMRPEDLIPVFENELEELDSGAYQQIMEEYNEKDYIAAFDEEITGVNDTTERDYYYMEALYDALNDVAPAFCYFGAHEGDGADYGFWISEEAIRDGIHDGTIIQVDAGDEWPDPMPEDVGYVLEVTDHGNMTLYSVSHGRLWSVV
jgi:hypothetical protein